jgi:ribosomal-protein-alanine N-acetyltransferase
MNDPKEYGEKSRDEEATPPGFYSAPKRVAFRPVRPADLHEIMAIETASFSSPWSTRFFLEELRDPRSHSLLCEMDGQITGYIIFWSLAEVVDIHNLAVRPDCRQKGIGRGLLAAAIHEAQCAKATRMTLEVRKSNEPAKRLYQSVGFTAQGLRKGYYSDNGEDALIMVMNLECPVS